MSSRPTPFHLYRFIFWSIVFLSGCQSTQAKVSTCNGYYYKADSLLRLKEYNAAFEYAMLAQECFQQEKLYANWLLSHYSINVLFRKKDSYLAASAYMDSILTIDWHPVKPVDYKALAWTRVQNGFNHKVLDNHPEAIYNYRCAQKWINLYKEIKGEDAYTDSILNVNLFYPLARAYLEINEFEKALNCMDSTYYDEISKKIMPYNANDLSTFYNHQANCLMGLKEHDKALAQFKKAIQIPFANPDMLAITYENMSRAYQGLEEYNLAKAVLNQAEEIVRNSEMEPQRKNWHFSKINLYRGYIEFYSENFSEARQVVKIATDYSLQAYPDTFDSKHAHHYLLYAQVCDSLKQYDEALTYYHKVTRIFCPNLDENDVQALPDSSALPIDLNLVDALVGKAYIWLRKAHNTSATTYLEPAIEAFRLASVVEDKLRVYYPHESARRRLSHQREVRTAHALQAVYDLWQLTQDESLLARAFFFMEQNRTQEMQSLLQQKEIGYELPPELDSMYQYMRFAQVSHYEWTRKKDSVLRHHPDQQAVMNQYTAIVGQKEQAYHELRDQLGYEIGEDHPQYLMWKFLPPKVSLTALQKQLPKDAAFLSYFMGEEVVYVLYIYQDRLHYEMKMLDSDFFYTVDQVKQFIRTPLPGRAERIAYQQQAHQLYQVLLGEIDTASVEDLIIVPPPRLYDMPFEVLLTRPTSSTTIWEYEKLPYVWLTHHISYALSAGAYTQIDTKRPAGSLPYEYVGFAPKYVTVSAAEAAGIAEIYKDLDHNAPEVQAISRLFETQGYTHKVFVDEAAKLSAFDAVGADARILHFAMHAETVDSTDINSFLVFTNTSYTTGRYASYKLYQYELYTQSLGAQLAIVSACKSGVGKKVVGDGVYHFGRAFRLAGVPNTLISLWEVDDAASSDIIPTFMTYLLQGYSQTEALYRARKAFLTDSDKSYSHKAPFYWAQFVWMGKPTPLYPSLHAEAPTWKLITRRVLYTLFSLLILWLIYEIYLQIQRRKVRS